MELDKFLAAEGPRAINPDMPAELIKDISKCPSLAGFKDELVRGWRVRQNMAILRQRRIGLASRALGSVERAGMKMIARIDPEHFFRFRQDNGPHVWHDRESLNDTLRRHPEMGVGEITRERGRLVLPVRGIGPAATFRKVYA